METKRQQKHARLVQKELGAIFQNDARHLLGKAMVTITRVLVSPDLSVARVYLSILVTDPETTYDLIQKHKKEIRHSLARRVGKSMRIVPELAFFPDESAAYAQHMDQVISNLDIPAASEDDDEEDQPAT